VDTAKAGIGAVLQRVSATATGASYRFGIAK
jgi:hypothetical protein